jgi:hypothetical protein
MTEAGSTPQGRETEPAGGAGPDTRAAPRRRHLTWAAVAVGVVCLGIVAVVSGSAIGGRATDPNEASAKATAEQWLQRFTPPPGARALSGIGKLRDAPSGPATPDEFDLHRSWLVTMPPAAVMAWLRAHPPAGLRESGSGSSSISGSSGGKVTTQAIDFGKPIDFGAPIGGAAVSGDLWVAVTDAPGGGSEIRADAVTTWTPTRPAGATIPAGVSRIVVAHSLPTGSTPSVHHLAVTRARDVAALRTAVNALPRARRGAFSCPLDRGESYDLTFDGPGGQAPIATVRAQMDGCRGVTLHVAGQSEIALEGSERLHDLLARLDP